MAYNKYLDHHDESYTGVENLYNGMDYNDYLFEEALNNLEND